MQAKKYYQHLALLWRIRNLILHLADSRGASTTTWVFMHERDLVGWPRQRSGHAPLPPTRVINSCAKSPGQRQGAIQGFRRPPTMMLGNKHAFSLMHQRQGHVKFYCAGMIFSRQGRPRSRWCPGRSDSCRHHLVPGPTRPRRYRPCGTRISTQGCPAPR